LAGAEGVIVREGQKVVGNACGAIEALLGEIHSGAHQDGVIRDDNVEYDTLKKKIFAGVGLLHYLQIHGVLQSFN